MARRERDEPKGLALDMSGKIDETGPGPAFLIRHSDFLIPAGSHILLL
jgi:hypothetical protein